MSWSQTALRVEASVPVASGGDTVPGGGERHRRRRRDGHVDVSWRGIHVVDNDGSEVYVGPGGIHVSEPADESAPSGIEVHGGITINGVHYDTLQEGREAWGHRCHPQVSGVDALVGLLAVVAMLSVGFLTPWGWGWAVCCLLAMPLWSAVNSVATAADANRRHRALRELWTIVVAAVFLVLGLGCGAWHPGWVVLLLIPVGQVLMSVVWGCRQPPSPDRVPGEGETPQI